MSDGGDDDDANSNGTWYLVDLPQGATATLTITASLDDDTAGQTLVNNAFIDKQDEIDPNTANNSSSASLTVLTTQQQITSLSAVSGTRHLRRDGITLRPHSRPAVQALPARLSASP